MANIEDKELLAERLVTGNLHAAGRDSCAVQTFHGTAPASLFTLAELAALT